MFFSTEKQLRDAAAAEVALVGSSCGDDEMVIGADGKPSRKRKTLNPDEKAKQNRDRNREHAKVAHAPSANNNIPWTNLLTN